MNLSSVKTRWQAFGLHLGLSFIIFLFLICIIVFIWYPGVFINMGGYQGIRIVAGVDLVLGPVLTLMVFNPHKKAKLIKLDLTVIAIVQFSALFAGTWLVYKERPLVQALSDDGVYVHTLSEFNLRDMNIKELDKISGSYPKLVYVELPEEKKLRNQLKMKSFFEDSRSITLDTSRYVDMGKANKKQVIARLAHNERNKTHNCFWLKLESVHRQGKVCFNSENGVISVD